MQTITFLFGVDGNDYGSGSCWGLELDNKPDYNFFYGTGKIIKNFPIDMLAKCFPDTFSIINGKLDINARGAWREIYKNPTNPALQTLADSWGVNIVVKRSFISGTSSVTPEIMSEFISNERR